MARSKRGRRLLLGGGLGAALVLGGALPVLAHDHYAEHAHRGTGQVLANSGNHPRFIRDDVNDPNSTYTSCESYGPIPGDSISSAWYGLETAHHGPDSGSPGFSERAAAGDRCYTADGNPATSDDRNPAIR